MKIINITLLSLVMNHAYAQTHEHHPAHDIKLEKPTEVNKKFNSPSDLKIRMEKILSLVGELKEKNKNSKVLVEYGNKITNTVNDIFKTCKLEPEADGAIHPALSLILEGTEEFKKRNYSSGNSKIHEALLDYEKRFTHEGWKP